MVQARIHAGVKVDKATLPNLKLCPIWPSPKKSWNNYTLFIYYQYFAPCKFPSSLPVYGGQRILPWSSQSFNLVTSSVKILGIYFSYNEEIMKEKHFVYVIKKIEKVLAVWRMRSLTLSGKITVLKSLIFSKIVLSVFYQIYQSVS